MATKADAGSDQMRRKTAVIDEIRAKLDAADAAVLTEYRGLTVTELATLLRPPDLAGVTHSKASRSVPSVWNGRPKWLV